MWVHPPVERIITCGWSFKSSIQAPTIYKRTWLHSGMINKRPTSPDFVSYEQYTLITVKKSRITRSVMSVSWNQHYNTERMVFFGLSNHLQAFQGSSFLPIQIMHYWKENPSRLPYDCIKFDPCKNGHIINAHMLLGFSNGRGGCFQCTTLTPLSIIGRPRGPGISCQWARCHFQLVTARFDHSIWMISCWFWKGTLINQ